MARIPISLACSENDRTRPVLDGRVPIEGCDVTAIVMEPAEIFFRAFRYQEWDVCELSLSSYLRTVSSGDAAYIGIPAFVSRVFRHSGFYIRTDRNIVEPADLRGRRVGVPEYQMTAAVWMRALLQEDYGVHPSEIDWCTGGQEQPGRHERTVLGEVAGVQITPIAKGKTLSQMLEKGEIDALLSARPPSAFLRGVPNVGRLLPDYRREERAYFERTKIFPIMHLIGVKRSLAEKHPWVPSSVYKAFCRAKDLAMAKLVDLTVLTIALPWVEAEARDTFALMGEDFWRYGVEENRKDLEALIKYSCDQDLICNQIKPEELFFNSTYEVSKT